MKEELIVLGGMSTRKRIPIEERIAMPVETAGSVERSETRKLWSGSENYDLYHISQEEFLERYPHRNKDAMRLRMKRNIDTNTPPDNYIGLRMGYWDIETTDFKADFGGLLCAAIADGFGNVVGRKRTDFPQAHILDDKGLCVWLRDTLETDYDCIVGWNSKMFDRDFLNVRLAVEHQERPLRERLHIDAMYLVPQGKMSRSLANVARALRVTDDEVFKTTFDKRIWALANAGDAASLDFIYDHNIKDVLLTRRVFGKLAGNVKNVHR